MFSQSIEPHSVLALMLFYFIFLGGGPILFLYMPSRPEPTLKGKINTVSCRNGSFSSTFQNEIFPFLSFKLPVMLSHMDLEVLSEWKGASLFTNTQRKCSRELCRHTVKECTFALKFGDRSLCVFLGFNCYLIAKYNKEYLQKKNRRHFVVRFSSPSFPHQWRVGLTGETSMPLRAVTQVVQSSLPSASRVIFMLRRALWYQL